MTRRRTPTTTTATTTARSPSTRSELGIHINTIRCGGDRETQLVWNEISNASAGRVRLDRSDGRRDRVAATPYDDKLAELNAKLVDTAIGYGSGRGEVTRKVGDGHRRWPPAAAADRAGFFGVKGGAVGGRAATTIWWCSRQGRVAAGGGAAWRALPTEMQAMTPAKREAYVNEKIVERNKIQTQINAIAKKRNEWMNKNAAARPPTASTPRSKARSRSRRSQSVWRSRLVAPSRLAAPTATRRPGRHQPQLMRRARSADVQQMPRLDGIGITRFIHIQ